METLFYFLIWGGLIFLMMRVCCGAHVLGHGRSNQGRSERNSARNVRWIPPKSDFDPVCNMPVRPETALSNVHDGHVYYFCSNHCRELFEALPEHFLPENRVARNGTAGKSHV